MSEAAKDERFVVLGRYLVDLKEKRFAPFTKAPDEVAKRCEADPEYAARFAWMRGLPPEV